MKKAGYVVLIVIFMALFFKACVHVDTSDKSVYGITSKQENKTFYSEYPAQENKTIDGVDYLESQAPIGEFGGILIDSTIGEGPKHLIRLTQKIILHQQCPILCTTGCWVRIRQQVSPYQNWQRIFP